jgi:hypothetical protein
MKDCAYVSKDSGGSISAGKMHSEEERYPSLSIYDEEAIKAVFGKTKLEAGQEYDVTPMRLKVKRVTTDAEDGVSNVELAVVGVGTIKAVAASRRTPMEDGGEGEMGEEED